MPRVFVVQKTEHNLAPAMDFGSIEFVASVNYPRFEAPSRHIEYMKSRLLEFDPVVDSLLIVGDPLNIGVAMAILSRRGPFRALKWDNVAARYVPVIVGVV